MSNVIPVEMIAEKIFEIRGRKVMLDSDLARLYGVTIRRLNEQVKRNRERFPEEFMFQLSDEENNSLRSQIATIKNGRGQHRKYLPYAFTEQGVAMLSAVLHSETAIKISIQIINAFVKLRNMLATNEALRYAIEGLERRVGKNERDIQIAIKAIQSIMAPPEQKKPKFKIGFTAPAGGQS
jgi:phage regulator Rha-like protein